MQKTYKHHLFPRRSQYVKYRGASGQIDLKDTIITILSKQPGLNALEIADLIYEPSLKKSIHWSVPRTLDQLEDESVIVLEEGDKRYFLMSDAMSHDIGKTKHIMDSLVHRGLTPEHITFLSSGIVMAAEAGKAKDEGLRFKLDEGSAAAVVNSETPYIQPVKVESWKEIPDKEITNAEDAVAVSDPFKVMTPSEEVSLKLQVTADIIREQQAEELKAKEQEFVKAIDEYKEEVNIPYTKEVLFVTHEDDKGANIETIEPERGIVITEAEPKKSFFGWLKDFIKF